jgi:hypothetical protein
MMATPLPKFPEELHRSWQGFFAWGDEDSFWCVHDSP